MPVSKAQQKATAKYIAKNYDDIKIRVPKGNKETYQEFAKQRGFKSLNSYVINLIEQDMERK